MKKIFKRYQFILITLSILSGAIQAQTAINEDRSFADISAQLDIKSADKGFLMPRMTQGDRLAIDAPSNGLLLFQTDSNTGFQFNGGTDLSPDWKRMVGAEELQGSEARTPVDVLDSNNDGSLTISEPGHYFLRDTLVMTASNGDAIIIDSDNVTLDLNGYAIMPGPQASDDGIVIFGLHNNITIKNGIISDFGGSGINALNANQSTFQNLIIKDNGGDGLVTDLNCLITNCSATGSGIDGLESDDGSIIQNCTASFNGDNGIQTSEGCIVINCTSFNNETDGIDVASGSRVEGCTVYGNVFFGVDLALGGMCINNTAYHNGQHGLDIASSSLVINNVSNENGVCITNSNCSSGGGLGTNTSQGAGIRTFANSVILNNQCSGNYFGIVISSTDATVKGNNVQNNRHAGILSTSSGSLIIQNTAHGNGYQQSPSVSDLTTYPMGDIEFNSINISLGPIINVTSAGDISTISGSTHPFANFVY